MIKAGKQERLSKHLSQTNHGRSIKGANDITHLALCESWDLNKWKNLISCLSYQQWHFYFNKGKQWYAREFTFVRLQAKTIFKCSL